MKRIVRPQTSQEEIEAFKAKQLEKERGEIVVDRPLKDISIDGLLGDGLLSLYREMRNLLFLSSKGKLSTADSKDLREIVKLLFELKDREKSLLEGLETDQLLESLNDTDKEG